MVPNECTDYIHQCNSGQAVLDQEDIPIIGTWTDYTGSDFGLRTAYGDIQNQNLGNKIMGHEAWVRENAQVKPRTVRGRNALTVRQRQHLEFVFDTKNPGFSAELDNY